MAETLEDLIVDESEMDRAVLHEILAPYVRLSKGTGQIVPTAAFSELSKNGTTKPTVVALAKKGLLVSENGRYSVPNHALPRVREAIK